VPEKDASIPQPAPFRADNREPFCNKEAVEWRAANEQADVALPDSPAAAAVYPGYIKELSEAQEAKLAAIESRAASVVTVSGALVTLVFAFTSVATGVTSYRPPPAARGWLIAAVTAFLVSGAASIAANMPRRVWAPEPDTMAKELWERWDSPGDIPIEKVTATRLAQWQATRGLTQMKARLLITAISTQIVAVGCVALAALAILAS